MKRTFKTVIISISLLLITSVIATSEVRAEEIKQQNQKIKYTKEQEQTVLKKIEELNKRDSKLNYNYLTKEEQLIRLEMMKKKYPIKWYLDMMKGFDFGSCEYDLMDYHCHQDKILYQVSQDKIISVLLHYDDLSDEFYRKSKEKEENDGDFYRSYMPYVDSFIKVLIQTQISSHIGSNAKLPELEDVYSRDSLTITEVVIMIKNKIILNSYRAYLEKEKDDCNLSRLNN